MSEENIYNNEKPPEEPDIKTVLKQDNGNYDDENPDIYVYDAEDDEPVTDKDLYSDFTGRRINAAIPVTDIEPALEKQTLNKPAPETESRPPEQEQPAAASRKIPTEPEYIGRNRINEPNEPECTPAPQLKINRIYTVNTVISMITLCVVAAGIFTGYAYLKRLEQDIGIAGKRISDLEESSETTAADEEVVDAISIIGDEQKEEAAVPMTDNIEIDRGKVLIYDSYVGYGWVPVLSGVRQHTYKTADFSVDDRYRMTYKPDGEESSYFGIDVSSYQGDIDWDAVRSDGVEFAILRVGVRGYGEEGNIKLDDCFLKNYDGAHKAGIDVGVYFFSQAISVEEAVEEANFVLKQLDGRKLEYPVVFDWEPANVTDPEDVPRTEDVMPGTLTLSAIAFCETIRDAGYDSMIYLGKKLAYLKYDMRQLGDYPVWLALYSTDLTYIYDFDIWQYGAGEVDGIEGDVDYNIAIIR